MFNFSCKTIFFYFKHLKVFPKFLKPCIVFLDFCYIDFIADTKDKIVQKLLN